jgi:peroxiredoxin
MLDKRWIVAVVGVAGLALVTMNGGMLGWSSRGGTASSAACDPNAKPMNLEFTLKDLNGADVKLSSFKGKVILLDFWATWCAPCMVEIPGFVELQTKYKAKGLVVVGLSVDDTIEQLKPFVAHYAMNYPVLLAKDHEEIQEAFGPLWGLPTTYVIGRDGKACRKHMGLTSKTQFEKEILGLL